VQVPGLHNTVNSSVLPGFGNIVDKERFLVCSISPMFLHNCFVEHFQRQLLLFKPSIAILLSSVASMYMFTLNCIVGQINDDEDRFDV